MKKEKGKDKQKTCSTCQTRNLLLLWYDISNKYLWPVKMSVSFPGQVHEPQRSACNEQKEGRKFGSIFHTPISFKPSFLSLIKEQYRGSMYLRKECTRGITEKLFLWCYATDRFSSITSHGYPQSDQKSLHLCP